MLVFFPNITSCESTIVVVSLKLKPNYYNLAYCIYDSIGFANMSQQEFSLHLLRSHYGVIKLAQQCRSTTH